MLVGAVALPGAKAWRSRDLRLGSDRHGELIERDGQPPVRRLLSGQLVMPPSNVLDEGMADTITLALRSCLRPRIGRSRAFSRPWSASTRLLAYCSVRCHGFTQLTGVYREATRAGRSVSHALGPARSAVRQLHQGPDDDGSPGGRGARHDESMGNPAAGTNPPSTGHPGGFVVDDGRSRRLEQRARRLGLRTCAATCRHAATPATASPPRRGTRRIRMDHQPGAGHPAHHPPIPVVSTHEVGLGQAPAAFSCWPNLPGRAGVKVERPTGRATLTPARAGKGSWDEKARLRRRSWSHKHPFGPPKGGSA